MEVIEGRWYFNTIDKREYRKCLVSQKNYNGYLKYSDAITSPEGFISQNDSSEKEILSSDKIASWSNIKEASLEEIQRYLPERHEDKINGFKKGDYIVFTESTLWSKAFPKNYIFKQRINSKYLEPELDANGYSTNGWKYYRNFDKNFQNNPRYKTNWRYGTKEEIAEYDRIGRSYCIDDLNKVSVNSNDYNYEVVHVKTQDELDFACKKCRPGTAMFNNKDSTEQFMSKYPEGIAVCIKYSSYCGLNYWKNNNANILSFNDWLKKYEFKNEFLWKMATNENHLVSKADSSTKQSNSNLPKVTLNVNFSLTKEVKPKFKLPKVKTINY